MMVLTEEMVFARTKTNNLSVITKLNCCANQLSDVSILRRMTDVTVLSLSVNNIETLEDMQFCTKLQELFVRKNNIKDLNEVCYLRDLVNLRHLWLGDNPCANDEGYRLAVIKTLPRLEKLDGVSIEESEYDRAQKIGRTLTLDPSDEREYYSDNGEETYEADTAEEDHYRNDHPSNNHTSTPYSPPPIQYYQEREDDRSRHEVVPKIENGHHENHHRQEPVENEPVHRVHASHHSVYEDRPEPVSHKNSHYSSMPRSRTQPNVQLDSDYTYPTSERKRRSCAGSTCCIQPQRRTNVLNAVLCLIKELDYPNLEVVQMTVKCRMEELDEMNHI